MSFRTSTATAEMVNARKNPEGARHFHWTWNWLIHVVVVVFIVSWFVPILALLVSSLRTQDDTATSGWWMAFIEPLFTIYNYELALDGAGVVGSLTTSLAIAVPTTILTTVLSTIGAYALTRMSFRGRAALSLLLVSLLVTPPQITLVPLLKVYNEIGLSGTVPGIWVYQVGFTVPFGIFLIRGFISSIPNELFESASVDGASPLRMFRSIAIPLSMPVMASLAIMQFLWSWNDLLVPLIFLGGSQLPNPITVELAGMAQQISQGQGTLLATTFLSVAVPLILVISLQRYFVRGVLGGAVKG
ncbi:carbohydrate ABC transporter permease [Paramicrobacterium chengjingii]|uniref:Carbohydrate ABC transporter permease n=1 Tax=Paramicrobacterium chengjingii TaxID=2769067 RepID=A0ABX6YKY4_9MICO|nr:carbohydrate ABC transporter permease [Microbacterium chengjingii]QPZ39461.1 carbohydrate ABC transporter permease [Microbacterium chengjingii]